MRAQRLNDGLSHHVADPLVLQIPATHMNRQVPTRGQLMVPQLAYGHFQKLGA